MNLKDTPKDPLEKRAWILMNATQALIPVSRDYVLREYHQSQLFLDCMDFVSNDMIDAPRADLKNLEKVWYFPWTEASREFEQAFNAYLLTMYKAAHDHLRRALELVIVGVYFTLEMTPVSEAQDWMSSKEATPGFSKRALTTIVKHHRFKYLDDRCNWSDQVKRLYWRLSDVTHVRGEEHGFWAIQPSRAHCSNVWMPQFSKDGGARVLDLYVEVARHVATAIAVANPIILVPLDTESKFGINSPLSGFFWEPGVQQLRGLIPDDFLSVIDEFLQSDPEVRSVVDWFENRPDISQEDIAIQLKDLRKQFDLGEDESNN